MDGHSEKGRDLWTGEGRHLLVYQKIIECVSSGSMMITYNSERGHSMEARASAVRRPLVAAPSTEPLRAFSM
jgi:hypothetical protein